jgi:FkbM family methyltransferase
MSLRGFILNCLNAVFRSRGMELRAFEKLENDCRMDAALLRASRFAPEIATVVDVGAAAGKWTRRALRFFPNARYLLIEPLNEQVPALEALRCENSRVEFVSAVAAAEPGEASLNVSADLDGSGIYDRPNANGRRVVATTIDREVASRGFSPPFFLKLDTHGFEVPILEGARATLAGTALLMIEAYNFRLTKICLRFPELCSRLEALGFLPCDVVEPQRRPGDGMLWQMDLVFARADAPFLARQTYY